MCSRPTPDGEACAPCRKLVESYGGIVIHGEYGFEILVPTERMADRMSTWAHVVRVAPR